MPDLEYALAELDLMPMSERVAEGLHAVLNKLLRHYHASMPCIALALRSNVASDWLNDPKHRSPFLNVFHSLRSISATGAFC